MNKFEKNKFSDKHVSSDSSLPSNKIKCYKMGSNWRPAAITNNVDKIRWSMLARLDIRHKALYRATDMSG